VNCQKKEKVVVCKSVSQREEKDVYTLFSHSRRKQQIGQHTVNAKANLVKKKNQDDCRDGTNNNPVLLCAAIKKQRKDAERNCGNRKICLEKSQR
jgi:hypothetical protein